MMLNKFQENWGIKNKSKLRRGVSWPGTSPKIRKSDWHVYAGDVAALLTYALWAVGVNVTTCGLKTRWWFTEINNCVFFWSSLLNYLWLMRIFVQEILSENGGNLKLDFTVGRKFLWRWLLSCSSVLTTWTIEFESVMVPCEKRWEICFLFRKLIVVLRKF